MTTKMCDMTGAADRSVPSQREISAIFFGLMIVMGLAAIDQSIVATALPRIIAEFGGVAHLSWVVTSYVLASTTTMPLYGKLSDQYGRKPILYAAILIFLFGSVLSGLSRNLVELIVFRGIQGLGAGGLLPLSQTIVADIMPPAERGRRQGAIVSVFAVCSVLGPLVGGIITDLLSWHWIFYVNLPVGAIALFVIGRALHRTMPLRHRKIDFIGAGLLTTATSSMLLVLSLGGTEWPWTSMQIKACGVIAIVLSALFVAHVRRAEEPVLPPKLFGSRLFVIACVALGLTNMGMFSASVFFPLFFQTVGGISPAHSGFLTGPLMIGVVISSVFNGRVLLKRGRYKSAQIWGLSVAVLSFAILAWSVSTGQPLFLVEPAVVSLGLGLGLVIPSMTVVVQNALSIDHRGVGTATLTFFRSLGGLIGVTGGGAILTARLRNSGYPSLASSSIQAANVPHRIVVEIYRHAIASVFATGAVIATLALVLILFLPELPLRTHHDDHSVGLTESTD